MENIGKYKLIGVLGKGAMGIVYKALDPDINREVAIKTIRFDLISKKSDKEDLMTRFLREAQAAGNLSHPNIITIYDVGRIDDLTYIVMQYVEGQSLQRIIDSGDKLPPQKIIQLMIQLCDALDFAHQKGIVHRDIKPANILLNKKGHPFIADFGVARVETSTLTQTGATIGTPSYMSPEQVMGKGVDKRTDIFSLGVILYELLTGKCPFQGESITTVIYKILNEEPKSLTDARKNLPAGFEPIVSKALIKDADKRYQACYQLAIDLQGLEQSSAKTMTIKMDEEGRLGLERVKKRKMGLILAVSISGILLLGSGGFWILSKKSEEKPSPLKEAQEIKAQDSLMPSQSETNLPEPVDDKLQKAEASFETGDYSEAVMLTEEILSEYVDNIKAQDLLEKAKGKMNEALIAQKLTSGIQSYEEGNYTQSKQIMGGILKLDKENREAGKYWALADTAISEEKIKQIIEQQRKAEEEKDLLSLLNDIGVQDVADQKKSDAVLFFNYYDKIKSLITNISIKFNNRSHAEVSFSHLLTAVYKKTGKGKVIFEGIRTWKMERIGRSWKIVSY